MGAIGGSIQEFTVQGRAFYVAADADANIDLGGFTNEQMVNGDGSTRLIKTRKPWRVEGLTISIDNSREDMRFLQDVANNQNNVTMSLTLADGTTLQGEGQLVDEVRFGTQNQTADISASGPNGLTPQ